MDQDITVILLRDIMTAFGARDRMWSKEIVDWFGLQLDKADRTVQNLDGSVEADRTAGARAAAWCGAMSTIAKSSGELGESGKNAARIRAAAVVVSNYRGSFTLKIFVGPYAKIVRL